MVPCEAGFLHAVLLPQPQWRLMEEIIEFGETLEQRQLLCRSGQTIHNHFQLSNHRFRASHPLLKKRQIVFCSIAQKKKNLSHVTEKTSLQHRNTQVEGVVGQTSHFHFNSLPSTMSSNGQSGKRSKLHNFC